MMAGLAGSMKNGNGMEDVAKLIGTLFMSRTYAHMCHLKTGSFAQHKALNSFYDDIVDLTDDLAEASQGYFGKLDVPYINLVGNVNDPIKGMQAHLKAIEKLAMSCEEEYLKNIFQEIQALYRKTLYLLTELV